MTTEEKAKKYDDALERARISRLQLLDIGEEATEIESIFPELKESEDERMSKAICYILNNTAYGLIEKTDFTVSQMIAWLEKQGEIPQIYETRDEEVITYTENEEYKVVDGCEDEKIRKALLEYFGEECDTATINGIYCYKIYDWLEKQKPVDANNLARGVLKSCALSFINYLDAHVYEGKMCVSNGECEDIENAFVNADWGKIGRYYTKFTQKPVELSKENELQKIFDEKILKELEKGIAEGIMYGREGYKISPNGEVKALNQEEIDKAFEMWNEEDEKNLNSVLSFIEEEKLRRWLKNKLLPLFAEEKNCEWSEEDEVFLKDTIECVDFVYKNYSTHKEFYKNLSNNTIDILEWLNSLKQRMGRE